MPSRYLEAAVITKTVGLRGEMRARLLCDGAETLKSFPLFLGGDHENVTVISAVPQKNEMCKIKLGGVDTAEQAQKLVGKTLYLDRETAELPKDVYFIADLIGLPVYDADSGELYGEISEVFQNSPTDVYSIKTESGKKLLFPAIPEVLVNVEIGNRIEIRPLKGLFADHEEIPPDED